MLSASDIDVLEWFEKHLENGPILVSKEGDKVLIYEVQRFSAVEPGKTFLSMLKRYREYLNPQQ